LYSSAQTPLDVWNLDTNTIAYSLKDEYVFTCASVSLIVNILIVYLDHPDKHIRDGMLNTYLLETGVKCQSKYGYYNAEFVPFSQGGLFTITITY
jgi:hypothetical protein